LPETTVAALYASGFVAGALSASFVGQLADKYGRRNACLLYCIIYSTACFSMLSDDLLILFAGRACGGVSTTLLYSVFETWMIAEYHDQALDAYGLSLGSMFGKMTTLSGVVAIVSGVVGDVQRRALSWLALFAWVWLSSLYQSDGLVLPESESNTLLTCLE
jgi:MFS family permease